MQNNRQRWTAHLLVAVCLGTAGGAMASEDSQASAQTSNDGALPGADAGAVQLDETFTTSMVFGKPAADGLAAGMRPRYFGVDSVFNRNQPDSSTPPTLFHGAVKQLRGAWPKWARWVQTGHASYYHDSLHGRRTANGERYDRHALTAAHRTLPLGTMLRVINLSNQKSVLVRVNDRGPYAAGRTLDLSRAAAAMLGYVSRGTTQVRMELVDATGATATEPTPLPGVQ